MKKPTATATSKAAPATLDPTEKKIALPVDLHIGYNHEGRMPKAALQKSINSALPNNPKLTLAMFVLSKGKHGLLCHPVMASENKEIYSRVSGSKNAYGHLPSYNSSDYGLKVELLTQQQLIDRALNVKKCETKRFKSRISGEEVDVVLLNPETQSYFVGLTVDAKGALRVINMEPSARYNEKSVQWSLLRVVTDEKLKIKLTNLSTKAVKAK